MTKTFTLLGEPQAKERPRFSSHNGRIYTPKSTKAYEEKIRRAYRQQYPELDPFPKGVPLQMEVETFHQIPKSASRALQEKMENRGVFPTKKPDVDNLVKIIADSLNNLAYHDDCQIVAVKIRKFYCRDPRVWVKISEIEV